MAAARRTKPSSEVSLVRSSLVSLSVVTREIVKTIGANGANVANGDAAQPLGLDCIEGMADTADMVGMVDMAGIVVVVEPMCLYISLCR